MLESNMDPGRSSVSMHSANDDRRRRPTEHRTLDELLLDEPHLVVHQVLFSLAKPERSGYFPFCSRPDRPCLAHVFCKRQIISCFDNMNDTHGHKRGIKLWSVVC